jgi:hypothetical protein
VAGSKRPRERRQKPPQIPCVFRGAFIREEVDPRIKSAWKGRPPWGDLRRTWKIEHCRRVNPTGHPEDCPYPERDCALAFLSAVLQVADADNPGAMFRRVAAYRGMDRADSKPLARDRHRARRPSDLAEPGMSREVVPGLGWEATHAVHDRGARPASLAELLRTYDPRPREGSPDDGQEGAHR